MIRSIIIVSIGIFLLLINGCSVDNTPTDTIGSDLPVFSSDSILTIGTFNIAWLGDGKDDKVMRSINDHKRIAQVISDLSPDIIALQEIENDEALGYIAEYLPGYSFSIIDTESSQDIAYMYKKDIDIEAISMIESVDVMPGRTRTALMVEGKKKDVDFILAAVHFKSTSRYDDTPEKKALSYELRRQQAEALSEYIDSMRTVKKDAFFAVIGDFNDNPRRSNTSISSLSQRMEFLTDSLPSCKNPLWTMIDHIAIPTDSDYGYIDNSLFVYNFNSSLSEEEAKLVSDHCPVIASFKLSQ